MQSWSEEAVKQLTDYAIEASLSDFADKENKYELFLEAVVHAQSYLILNGSPSVSSTV